MTSKLEEFPGVSLRESDFQEGRTLFTEWEPNARYAWDTGVAIGRYLQELKAGRLVGVRCDECRRIVIPPRSFCEWCYKPMDDWVPLPDTGTVNTFSLCYVTWDMQYLDEPQIPAVIDIDGTRPTVGIMHMLGDVSPDDVRIGMRVQAVWKPPEEREGSILDIRHFRPL
ncbi:MAG TPA: Zn-ribbon domain-containing OB-fold protein [Anaerolineae bacterium]|nr:Zn-ribbon domain-containing OB-fold protein [Anaerolineae bacterium]